MNWHWCEFVAGCFAAGLIAFIIGSERGVQVGLEQAYRNASIDRAGEFLLDNKTGKIEFKFYRPINSCDEAIKEALERQHRILTTGSPFPKKVNEPMKGITIESEGIRKGVDH